MAYVKGKWVNRNVKSITEPKDFEDRSKLSLVLYTQSWLEAIKDECLEQAKASEFQIGYRALVVRMINHNSEFLITIPTATYNFPQEVTGAHIDYELLDVTKHAEMASPHSMEKVATLLKDMPILTHLEAMSQDKGYEYTVKEINCGSMHRHPGDFGFSQTDYDKDPEHPGVVYRMGNVEDHPQTDSVMYFGHGAKPKIVVTETRIVNVKPHEDGGIEGSYDEVPTICVMVNDVVEELGINQLLEFPKEKVVYSVKSTLGAKHNSPVVKMIIDAFVASNHTPDMQEVDKEHIQQKAYGFQGGKVHGGKVYYSIPDKKKETKKKSSKTITSTMGMIGTRNEEWLEFTQSLSAADFKEVRETFNLVRKNKSMKQTQIDDTIEFYKDYWMEIGEVQ